MQRGFDANGAAWRGNNAGELQRYGERLYADGKRNDTGRNGEHSFDCELTEIPQVKIVKARVITGECWDHAK